jgi:putative flippase GtrA
LSKLFPQFPLLVDQLAAIVPTTAINYFLNSYWTFKPKATARDSLLVATASSSTGVVRNRSTLS